MKKDKFDKRINRIFRTERRDIKFPMWRKKVDASIFKDRAILIPKFAEKMWETSKMFHGLTSRKDEKTQVDILFKKKLYKANVCDLNAKKRKGSFRIWLPKDIVIVLKETFLMTFMRDLEFKLGSKEYTNQKISIEDEIPFNEFLDIEFDKKNRRFIFNAHYTQPPILPNLFSTILGSTILKSIILEGEENLGNRILKSKWRTKDELDQIVDASNVIYILLDKLNREIYVGESEHLKNRLSQHRPEIPNWTHFRYNKLPDILEPFRVEIERMLIRDYASIFPTSKKKVNHIFLSDYILKNKKIDD